MKQLDVSPAVAMECAAGLCEIGPKYAGTQGEIQARDFILSRLRTFGFPEVRVEPFEYLNYMPGQAQLALTYPAAWRATVCEPLQFAATAEVEGELIYIGRGRESDIANLDALGKRLAGRIAVTSGWPPFFLYPLAERAGAIGYVTITRHPDNLVALGAARFDQQVGTIPGLTIGANDGEHLLCLMAAGTVRARLSAEGRASRETSWNLVARHGSTAGIDTVLCSHYDSQNAGAHAWDNVSGCAGLLAIAHTLTSQRLPVDMTLAFVGCEEQGLAGSRAYVRAHNVSPQTVSGVVNLDGLSSALCPVHMIEATDDGAPIAREAARDLRWRVDCVLGTEANSDHAPFVDSGVTAIWAHEGVRDPYQHTAGDILAHLRGEDVAHAASVALACAISLAQRPRSSWGSAPGAA